MKLSKKFKSEFLERVIKSLNRPKFEHMYQSIWHSIIYNRLPFALSKLYNDHPEFFDIKLINKFIDECKVDYACNAFKDDYDEFLYSALVEVDLWKEEFELRENALKKLVVEGLKKVNTMRQFERVFSNYLYLIHNTEKPLTLF